MAEILYKELSYRVIGVAMEVHKILGSAFLEAVYQAAFDYELTVRGIPFEPQKPLPVNYKGQIIGEYKADFVVDKLIILELKAVSTITETHDAQAHNYLAATGLRLAIIINFASKSLEYKRIVK